MSKTKKRKKSTIASIVKRRKQVLKRQRLDVAYEHFENGEYEAAVEELTKSDRDGTLSINTLELWFRDQLSHKEL